VRQLVRSLGLVALGAAFVTAACSNPVSPTDTSPGALDVRIAVLDIYPNQNDLAVVMQFLSGGKVVKFASGETVTCDNVALSFNGLTSGYAGRVPQLAPGGKFQFVYTRSGTQTTVEVTAPARPAILTPASNANVPRTTSLTITYTPAGGAALRGSARDATSSEGSQGEQRTTASTRVWTSPWARPGPGRSA